MSDIIQGGKMISYIVKDNGSDIFQNNGVYYIPDKFVLQIPGKCCLIYSRKMVSDIFQKIRL